MQVDAESICALTTFLSMFKVQIRKIGLLLSSLSSCFTPAYACVVAIRHFPHFSPLHGNVDDGTVDVSRHTKNTVTTGAIWLCS